MKAIVATQYGGPEVLQLEQVDKPTPKQNEMLIRVHATTVSAGGFSDAELTVPPLLWIPARIALGITKPKQPILGMELAGEVESVGQNVTRFKAGDQVFASTLAHNFGAYAEYKCLPEGGMVALKPRNMSYEQAAAVPIGATTALRLLRKGNIQRGQKIMIYGASGSVGTYAVQLAKYFGAEVTAVSSTSNRALVKSLGADHVIDYTREDFSNYRGRYDIIFDTVAKFQKADYAQLAPGATYLSIAALETKEQLDNLLCIKQLTEAGVLKAVIDRCYPLEQMTEAHRYVDAGHKKETLSLLWSRPMSNEHDISRGADRPMLYQIKVKGLLGQQWINLFQGLTITQDQEGNALLIGPVADQAALHGILRKVRDLGIPLLSVTLLDSDRSGAGRFAGLRSVYANTPTGYAPALKQR